MEKVTALGAIKLSPSVTLSWSGEEKMVKRFPGARHGAGHDADDSVCVGAGHGVDPYRRTRQHGIRHV